MKRSIPLPPPRALALVVGLALLAGCGDDDGAAVRDGTVTELGGEAGSASASASGSASASASAPASGSASAPAGGSSEAATSDGGYDYATDVNAHRLVTRDVCAVNEALDPDAPDFTAAAEAYRDGGASVNSDGSVRTLAGFATAADRLHGLDEHYGSDAPLDEFVSSALEGTDRFSGEDDAVRRQGAQKGVQNQVMVAWTVHELRSALDKAAAGDFDPAEGAVHNWDEAWAFYHGAEPTCAPYATADSRAGNFGTVAGDGTTALANERILAAMEEGRDALLAEDAAGAQAAADEIMRNLVITYSQAAVRYATIMGEDVAAGDAATAREHQTEGLAFWRVIEPYAAEAGADVEAINGVLELSNQPSEGAGDTVTEALQPAWDTLGISSEDIGTLS